MTSTSPTSRRRNAPSLANLHLAPLSTTLITEHNHRDRSPNTSGTHAPTTSYIAGYGRKSAPTTPGILSRSSSRARLTSGKQGANSKSYSHLAFADTVDAGLRRATGSSAGLSAYDTSHSRSGARKQAAKLKQGRKRDGQEADGEWLHRAGTAIATEARESKGQSWLASRASSTSLLARDDPSDKEEGDAIAQPSRSVSRTQSARNSRRGSRIDVSGAGLTSFTAGSSRRASRTSLGLDGEGGYFSGRTGRRSGRETPAGPDFVDYFEEDEESDEEDVERVREEARKADEEIVARLARGKGNGIGGIIDRLAGWTMFPEKGAETEDDNEDDMYQERPDTTVQATQRAPPMLGERKPESTDADASRGDGNMKKDDEASTWSDAAWLLSVASKVLF